MAPPKMEVEQFFHYMKSVRRPNTATKYMSAAEKLLAFLARNGIRFANMPPNILSLYSEALIHSGLKPASVLVYVAGAKRFIEWSRARGETNVIVNTFTDLPKVTRLPPNALKEEHILAYMALAGRFPEPRRTALLLMPYTGLRASEMLGLTVSAITKVRSAKPGKNGLHSEYLCLTVTGKGGDVRVIPILLDGAGILVSYLKNWRTHIQRKGPLLLCDAHGKGIPGRTFSDAFQKIHKMIGVARLTPHTMRKTYLSTLRRSGVDITTMTKLAGHKSYQTTLNHYLEIHTEDLIDSLDRAGARLVERSGYAAHVDAASRNALEFLKSRKPGDLE